jgi:hypothetical protein
MLDALARPVRRFALPLVLACVEPGDTVGLMIPPG